jgi:hypothetical protein
MNLKTLFRPCCLALNPAIFSPHSRSADSGPDHRPPHYIRHQTLSLFPLFHQSTQSIMSILQARPCAGAPEVCSHGSYMLANPRAGPTISKSAGNKENGQWEAGYV